MSKAYRLVLHGFVSLVILVSGAHLQAQSGIYDRIGVIPKHGTFGSLPEENIDLFTGNVTLRYRDVYLPGPNGLDVEVWRVYNSKILCDWQSGEPRIQAYHQSWVGIGWTMHMGMVHDYNSDTPVIEFPDGRLETAYTNQLAPGKYITSDFLRYDKGPLPLIPPKLYFHNGVCWTFGAARTITRADGTSDAVRLVTRIENSFGQHIDVTYNASSPTISKITDGFGRVITFSSVGTPRRLTQISYKYTATQNRIVTYTVGAFANGYSKLISVDPPCLEPVTFEYNDGVLGHYELKKITTSYGGVLEYLYDDHAFYFGSTQLNSRVVSQKKITFSAGEQPSVWIFTYPSYAGAASGTVSVQGPVYNTAVTYNAYDPDSPWKLGTINGFQYEDGSFAEARDWTHQEISSDHWTLLGTDMGTAKGLMPSSVTRHRSGGSILKEEYLYDEAPIYKKYGLPWKVRRYVNGSDSPLNSSTKDYYFAGRPTIEEKYLLSLPYSEKEYSGDGLAGGVLIKAKYSDYYEEDGKWGALNHVRLLKPGSEFEYNEWTYYYQPGDEQGKTILISALGPTGSARSTTYNYGVKKKDTLGDTTLLSCTISEYDSSVITASTQDGAVIGLLYDALGRVTQENWPDDRNDRIIEWCPNDENKSITTRGNHTITKFWDGMGRDTGYIESGDGVTLYSRKTLDAEGRVTAQSTGGVDPQHETHFLHNSVGDMIQITDPMNRVTHMEFVGTTKTVTDPEGHPTSFEYHHLPGLPTAVTDAQGHRAVYTYDDLGRLMSVDYNNGARTHHFQYDRADNLLSETHPETGLISYSYNEENWLVRKTWGDAITNFSYTSSGQLFNVSSGSPLPEEAITYTYNTHGRVFRISSTKGWKRDNITYDPYGNVTSETISIPGLSAKTVTYTYDRNNNPEKITYPDQNWAKVTSNGLDAPETLAFNGDSNLLVGAASYGPGKAVTSLAFTRNDTQYSASYFSSGDIDTISLTKGSTALYNASYTYDANGNVLGISSTAPAINAAFGYDELNRLTSAAYSTGRVSAFSYAYDEYGNMRTVRENGATVFDKAYGGDNRVIGDSYDTRGNLLSSGGHNYHWNQLNQLEYVTNPAGVVLGRYLYDERGLRIRAIPPLPEIDVECEAVDLPDGGEVLFESEVGQYVEKTFMVKNEGEGELNLAGSPIIAITGLNSDQFSVQLQPSSPVLPAGSTTFIVRFAPTSYGSKMASILISNNDPDEYSYDITLNGNPHPEMNIPQVPDGGSWDFGTVAIPDFVEVEFTIQNLGKTDLVLSGNPPVAISGDPYGQFVVVQQPNALIPPGGETYFLVDYVALRIGQSYAQLSIANNDPDENPYNMTLMGYGVRTGESEENALDITSPDGGEKVLAGSIQTITWTGGKTTQYVKIECSTDNGSSYKTIVERTPNTGIYDWLVPTELSPACLIRISDPDGMAAAPKTLTFGFNLKVSCPLDQVDSDTQVGIRASLPDLEAQVSLAADLAIMLDPQGSIEKAKLNGAETELKDVGVYSATWNNVQIKFNLDDLSAALILDGQIIMENIPLISKPIETLVPEIAIFRDPIASTEAWIDDFEVNFLDKTATLLSAGELVIKPIVRDMFDPYMTGDFPSPGGWFVESDEAAILLAAIDGSDYISPQKALKLSQTEVGTVPVAKGIALPATVPYDVSLSSFAITSEIAQLQVEGSEPDPEEEEGLLDRSLVGGSGSEAEAILGSDAEGTALATLSGSRVGCYYIYAFDGRLLAEYDVYGNCLKEYIYMGSGLVAEYDPATSQYYYYTQDQIGSTRVVTDGAGAVIYAAAHDPYGGIQQTWANAFDPKRKFSDKERDEETGLDYFGARYFATASYRWISVDPLLTERAINNPQEWNLYSYSRNNPIAFFDPDGKSVFGIAVDPSVMVNFAVTYVMMKEILNYFAGYISSTNALNTLLYRADNEGAEGWLGTPYDLAGEKSIRLVVGDCSGIASKILIAAGYLYTHRNTASFSDSLKKGGINEGILGRIPPGWAPQPGDFGLWAGRHICIFARREGVVDYVYNASKTAGFFQIQLLGGIIKDFKGEPPIWYRLRIR